jgi:signal peptidase I
VLCLALVTSAIVALCTMFQVVVVPTPSMESTVLVGDHLLVNKFAYRWHAVKRGDVISFLPPHRTDQVYLKRVVAIGGDRIDFRDGAMFVNGVRVPEHHGAHLCSLFGLKSQTLIVPPEHLYVLGDNRNHSEDSRSWGPVAENRVVGAPVVVLWSFAVPTEEWLNHTPGAVYLNHPLAHLRWTRILRSLQ